MRKFFFFLNVKLKMGHIDEARSAISEIDNHLRQAIFFNLRQPPDSEVKFQDRLHKWLEEWSLVAGIEVEREIGITDRTFTSSEEMLMFGIIQEAFTNIRKHSGAENARLTLTGTAGSWELTIEDDGIGLERPGSANQYGISMIRKRAGDLQADFNIGKKRDKGTIIRLHSRKGAP